MLIKKSSILHLFFERLMVLKCAEKKSSSDNFSDSLDNLEEEK